LEDIIICSGKDYNLDNTNLKGNYNIQYRHYCDLVQENIVDLLTQNKKNYVQTFGYELRGTHFSSTKLNLINKNLMLSPHFEKILEIFGENVIIMILSNFYVKFIFVFVIMGI